MKSLMHEAATIMKAIEQAWTKAGKPQKFSVKIFEEAEHSFLGFTKKNAKVGIFFEQSDIKSVSEKEQPRKRQQRPRSQQQPQHREKPKKTQPERTQQEAPRKQREAREHKTPLWTPDMVSIMERLIKEQLDAIGQPEKSYTLRANRYYLKCHFEAPVMETSEREKQLFRSWAHLLMHILRHKLKKQLRGFKLVLSSG